VALLLRNGIAVISEEEIELAAELLTTLHLGGTEEPVTCEATGF